MGAFVWQANVDEPADEVPTAANGALTGLANHRREPGERLFDRVEVGAVEREGARAAPTASIRSFTAARLLLERLSIMTMTSERSSGTRTMFT